MKLIQIILLLTITSCSGMWPAVAQTMDDYVTDEAIGVKVDKAAMQKDTDVRISIDVINKNAPTPSK